LRIALVYFALSGWHAVAWRWPNHALKRTAVRDYGASECCGRRRFAKALGPNMKLPFVLLLILIASPAKACFAPPEHLAATPDELIERTESISLATVVKAEVSGNDVVYTLRTIKLVKGHSEKEFQITGEPLRFPMQSDSYNNHTDQEFWESEIGRITMETDCKVHPSFSVGGTYLAFLGQPYHTKSFEIINIVSGERQDRWLKYVLGRVGP
jgi:hypothetical protein